MLYFQEELTIHTSGRSILDITGDAQRIVEHTRVQRGLCHIFLHHTSASLILCENADPAVRHDLEAFMQRLIPDGDPLCSHVDEGPDDMPSHIRTVLTQSFLSLPIRHSKIVLGTWQGIYLWEHRLQGHARKLTITVQGQK